VIAESINWHWIFFVNLPIGVVTALLAVRLLERDRGIGFGQGADVVGALLITGALMLGVYTIVKPAAEQGWGSSQTLGLGAVALALLAAFVVREATARNPLVPLRIFRSRNVSGANIVQALSVAGMFGMFFLGSLYLQRVLGYDPLEIGLAFLPVTLVMGTLSVRYSERMVTRFGARATLLPGLGLVGAGLALFTQVPADGSYVVDVLPSMILLGAGAGTAFPALMNISMSGATPSDAGLASGLVNTTMQVGGALGLAVLATLATTRTNSLRGSGDSVVQSLVGGYHLAFVIALGLIVAALVVALTILKPDRAAAPENDEPARSSEPARNGEPAYERG
jgi:predicted MFS family arabinose efflux permease